VAKRKNDTLKRKTGGRKYRDICWVSAEGQTEKDYLRMNVFKDSSVVVRFPKEIHPDRRNPEAVLKRFKKAINAEDFRNGDEAWLMVDVDTWSEYEFAKLLSWANSDPRHHLAVSNPKFELFLVMHFERGRGCTTPQKVDEALKRNWPQYNKRVSATQFSLTEVEAAVENAALKRASCKDALPAPGMTDAHLLIARLIR
jgi:hypothetical protein